MILSTDIYPGLSLNLFFETKREKETITRERTLV